MPRQRERAASATRKLVLALLAIGAVLIAAGVVILVLRDDDDKVSMDWLEDPPKGPVRFCAGDDESQSQSRSERDYNRRRAPGSVATFVKTTFTADKQHDLFLRALEQGSDECDVIYLDVVYTAEFAARGLLYDMTPYLEAGNRRDDFDERAMRTAEYDRKLWSVPKQLDVGVMYYRSDLASRPESWLDVYRQAKRGSATRGLPGLRLQRGRYEGLTVVFLELAYSAGASPIVSDDGETANLDQPQVLEALEFMRNAVRQDVIPDVVQTDEANLGVYERGRALFLRGWPYIAARIEEDAKGPIKRKAAANTQVVALPPWRPGGRSVGVLGGHSLVIPRSAENPEAALHLIEFLTSATQILKDVKEDSQFPVLASLQSDPDLSSNELLNAIKETDVMPRPSIVNYAEVSSIIFKGVTEVLDGKASASTKLGEIQRDVQAALDGDAP